MFHVSRGWMRRSPKCYWIKKQIEPFLIHPSVCFIYQVIYRGLCSGTVLTGLTGWTPGKNCLVSMDAFTQTSNAAVTLLSGKYSYLDILWNRCTSYWNASGWVKSSLQSFVLFHGHVFLFLFHCLVYHENAVMF